MALRPEEVLFVKYSLGVSVTLIGAEPYITYLAIFDQAIAPFIVDPATTSSTMVQASTAVDDQGEPQPTAVQLTLAAVPTLPAPSNLPAFAVGTTVVVDVGRQAEKAQIEVLSGTTIWVSLRNAHGTNGPYPVVMAGGEAVVRNILQRLYTLERAISKIAPRTAGVRSVSDVQLYAGTKTGGRGAETLDPFNSLLEQREHARDDLGEAVGFTNLRRNRASAGNRMVPV